MICNTHRLSQEQPKAPAVQLANGKARGNTLYGVSLGLFYLEVAIAPRLCPVKGGKGAGRQPVSRLHPVRSAFGWRQ